MKNGEWVSEGAATARADMKTLDPAPLTFAASPGEPRSKPR